MPGAIAYSPTTVPDMIEVQAYNLDGKLRTITINMTPDSFMDAYVKWQTGSLVQDAFPSLSAGEREFLMTGCNDEEWDQMFPPTKED
jgi:hypothetical protein